ncbi:MAG: hypothetical protein COA96_10275 [SAR86 cluster bacterium]|uniref:Uncharacterized protein n=1 Tax=SAR86 cluster bacterium TaxID=2030880 RepID=A0A2A5AXZ5_9GAMM|nr:MAG: hypothetical protein COA96_10275 [SAR86 cluster bacterium]
MTHPFRNHQIRIYQSVAGDGPKFTGYIGPTNMRFSGETQDDVFEEADAFRIKAIEDHEAALIARQEAAAKAKAKRKAGKS